MQFERNHLVWNPVFTLIDHIGRHIDMSAVHKKFEIYVRTLLTPLYEELAQNQYEGEEKWKTNLRSLAKTFLCRAGYKPCIEEAQKVFKKWMDSPEPDLGNPFVIINYLVKCTFLSYICFSLQSSKSIYMSCFQIWHAR